MGTVTSSPRNRAIALAAVFQACELVSEIAWRGQAEPGAFAACLESLLRTEAEDIEAVYGGIENLQLGLKTLRAQLAGGPEGRRGELTRYAVSLLYLQRRLERNPAMIERLREGIAQAQAQREFFAPTHANMIARLAELYQQTISRIGPRIIVQGEQSLLTNSDNAAKIRSLLLAGIRAAVLWRQAGGNRWRLLFGRQSLLREAQALLAR